jgi:hypothetical protein
MEATSMRSPHRLADPIEAILSFVASRPLDVRRLERIDELEGVWARTAPRGYGAVANGMAALQARGGSALARGSLRA